VYKELDEIDARLHGKDYYNAEKSKALELKIDNLVQVGARDKNYNSFFCLNESCLFDLTLRTKISICFSKYLYLPRPSRDCRTIKKLLMVLI
jgi:hypothetical protein